MGKEQPTPSGATRLEAEERKRLDAVRKILAAVRQLCAALQACRIGSMVPGCNERIDSGIADVRARQPVPHADVVEPHHQGPQEDHSKRWKQYPHQGIPLAMRPHGHYHRRDHSDYPHHSKRSPDPHRRPPRQLESRERVSYSIPIGLRDRLTACLQKNCPRPVRPAPSLPSSTLFQPAPAAKELPGLPDRLEQKSQLGQQNSHEHDAHNDVGHGNNINEEHAHNQPPRSMQNQYGSFADMRWSNASQEPGEQRGPCSGTACGPLRALVSPSTARIIFLSTDCRRIGRTRG